MDWVELAVRLTARSSAIVFTAALVLFALGDGRTRRHAIATLAAFIGIHTVHFGTIVWLSALTAGENIRDRGGWVVALAVAAMFYAACFTMMRAWRRVAAAEPLPAAQRAVTHASTLAIWVIFVNSYVSRIPRDWRFAIPVAGLTLALFVYFRRGMTTARGEPASVR